jgi:glycosyltransferase involved in cell wall biosynthesis
VPPLVAIDLRDAAEPQLRGWGRYAKCLAAALQARAPDGFELAPITDGGSGPEILFEQVGLPLTLRRRKAALIHATNCFLPLIRPCPGVVTIHDLAFEAWPADFRARTRVKYRVLTRLAARSAQRIICPSDFTAQDVCLRYGIDRAKVHVILEAPALPRRDDSPPPGPYLLAVGDLRQKKNLIALVRTFAELRQTAAIPHRLVLAGVDGGQGPELMRAADGHPVELTGYVSDRRLDALIRGADVVVHPSLYEGFGLVVLEAMARGVPVIAARAGALPQTGGEAALYFDPGAVTDELATKLARLLADPSEREQRARAGREWAAGFSWERTARETAGVYRELL